MASSDKSSDMEDVKKKLAEDGLDPDCTFDEKISHLWNLYLKSESSLQASFQNISELRKQQTEEMREVENYVEHIRSLSDEREALTLEFEAENEQLKGQITDLKQQVEGYKNDESSDMLLQQGLDDIAYGTSSEQIAYLLVERARLMDELEAEQGGNMIDTPEGPLTAQQLYGILQQERNDFEEELSQQREGLSGAKDNLREEFEEELSAIMEENDKLQNLLSESRKKIEGLEDEIDTLKTNIEDKGTDEETSQKSENGAIHARCQLEVTNLRESNEKLEKKVKEIQADNRTLMDNVQTATIELQEEKTKANNFQIDCEKNEQELQSQIDRLTLDVRKSESRNDKLSAEQKSAERRAEVLEEEARKYIETERDLHREIDTLQAGQSSPTHLQNEIDRLKEDKRTLLDEVADLKGDLRSEKDSNFELDLQLKRAESDTKSAGHEAEIQEKRDKTKIDRLNEEIRKLKEELDKSFDELRNANSKGQQNEDAKSEVQYQMEHLREQILSEQRKHELLEDRLKDSQEETKQANKRYEDLQEEKLRSHRHIEEEKEEILNKQFRTEMSLKETEEKLKRESQRSKVREDLSDEENLEASKKRLDQVTDDLDSLRAENVRVNKELSTTQEELGKYRSQSELDKEKADQIIHSLRTDLVNAKTSENQEKDSLSSRLEQIYHENRELRNKYSRKEEELASQRFDFEKTKVSGVQINAQFDAEKRHRSDIELRNITLEEEAAKAHTKLKETLVKLEKLELKHEQLEDEFRKKTREMRENESELNRKAIEQQTQIRLSQSRTDSAEKKLFELQNDLEEALSRLQTAEQQVREISQVRTQFGNKQEEVKDLRTQLQEERLKRTTETHTSSSEVQLQLTTYREKERELQKRNNELQHMLLDVESKVQNMKDQTQTNTESRLIAEQSRRQMTDQLDQRQRDMEAMQVQLYNMSEKYDTQCRKYAERKIRTQNKLHKAREMFTSEKFKLKSEVDRLQNELVLTKTELVTEKRQRAHVEDGQHKLVLENRDLMSRISEFEEAIRDQNRKVSILQVRTKFLEDENNTLQQRVDSLTRQKHNLDRIVKEYQMERQREEMKYKISSHSDILTSPRTLASSIADVSLDLQEVNSRYDNKNILEAIISPRIRSPVSDDGFGLSQTLPNTKSAQNGIEDLEEASLPPPINHDTFPAYTATSSTVQTRLDFSTVDNSNQQASGNTDNLFTSVSQTHHLQSTRDQNSNGAFDQDDSDEHTYENSDLKRSVQAALDVDGDLNSFDDSDFDLHSTDSIVEL